MEDTEPYDFLVGVQTRLIETFTSYISTVENVKGQMEAGLALLKSKQTRGTQRLFFWVVSKC